MDIDMCIHAHVWVSLMPRAYTCMCMCRRANLWSLGNTDNACLNTLRTWIILSKNCENCFSRSVLDSSNNTFITVVSIWSDEWCATYKIVCKIIINIHTHILLAGFHLETFIREGSSFLTMNCGYDEMKNRCGFYYSKRSLHSVQPMKHTKLPWMELDSVSL